MTSFGDISDLGLMSRLHKAVSNPHLVKLFSYFEDPNFVYIVLELCRFFADTLYIYPQELIKYQANFNQEEKLDGASQETESNYGA